MARKKVATADNEPAPDTVAAAVCEGCGRRPVYAECSFVMGYWRHTACCDPGAFPAGGRLIRDTIMTRE